MRIRTLSLSGVTAVLATALATTALTGTAATADEWTGVGSLTLTSTTGTAPVIYSGDTLTFTVSISSAESTCVAGATDRTVNLVSVSAALNAPSQVVVPAGQCTASFDVTTNPVTILTHAGFGAVTSDDPDPRADEIGTAVSVYPKPGTPGSDTLQLTHGQYDPRSHEVTLDVTGTIPTASLTATLRTGGHNSTAFPMSSDGKGSLLVRRRPRL